ncbi:hypothetical protein GA0061105_102185 [Rhizobium aethiopicum]|uniref:Uncharacterized protein n=1 Tax=Rhizobium aethiopicum TaxID=1138170 RepID=A0A1C3XY68_9HYPH|nr:hypothetical protein [Rhizobium aethiopicum]SCB57198.1 hypothetical protein GA0061105_102185 [Rhizobium aethiopicum]
MVKGIRLDTPSRSAPRLEGRRSLHYLQDLQARRRSEGYAGAMMLDHRGQEVTRFRKLALSLNDLDDLQTLIHTEPSLY